MLTFDKEAHIYRWNGEIVPSVTQILKPLSALSYGTIPSAVLAHAADRGTAVHNATWFYDQDDLDESTLDPEVAPYVAAYIEWRKVSGFEIETIETPVYSERLRYAGTPDRVVRKGRKEGILDIKTTLRLEMGVGPQTAGYLEAENEQRRAWHGDLLRYRWALQLKSDGRFELTEMTSPEDIGEFYALCHHHHWLKKQETTR